MSVYVGLSGCGRVDVGGFGSDPEGDLGRTPQRFLWFCLNAEFVLLPVLTRWRGKGNGNWRVEHLVFHRAIALQIKFNLSLFFSVKKLIYQSRTYLNEYSFGSTMTVFLTKYVST